MSESSRLRQVDRKLHELSKKISFLDINPINEIEEHETFMSNPEYEPQFKYVKLRFDPQKTIAELDKLDIRYTAVDTIFRKHVQRLKQTIRMLEARGTIRATRTSEKIYGLPDQKLITKAKEILSKPLKKKNEGADLTTKQILRMMNTAFVKFGANWTVREKDMSAHAAVHASSRELLIRTNSKFSKQFVKRLIVHEIGTHVLRAENGARQPYRIFQYGLPNYMKTEEGLAVYNEELNNCLDQEVLRRYAGRVIAIETALKSSFRETYNKLTEFFDEDFAWRTAVRVKRGLADTKEKGAFTKDHLYLKGYLEVKEYVESGKDLKDLYFGKVGIEHVDDLKKIPGLIHPMYLPFFRYFEFYIEIIHELVKFPFRVILKPVLSPFDVKNYENLFKAFKRPKKQKEDKKELKK